MSERRCFTASFVLFGTDVYKRQIPYTASVYNGLSRLFGMAFGLPYEWCVIGMAVITCIYVVLGGYMATVMNLSLIHIYYHAWYSRRTAAECKAVFSCGAGCAGPGVRAGCGVLPFPTS